MSPRATSRLLAALIVVAGAVAAVVIALTGPSAASPTHQFESMFQDDDHLIYASTPTVISTLSRLQSLGVQRLRVTVLWRAIAPAAGSAAPPAGFDASNPADYPAGSWLPYDRLLRLAQARGMGVDFNVGAPGPRWATAPGAPGARFANHWYPSALQFGRFVTALGRRYSGAYRLAGGGRLPRVDYWSIWNEPNQPGWLAPQWRTAHGVAVMSSPVLYRAYVRAGFEALLSTGHGPGHDTILIGELAPEGSESPAHSYSEPIPPMPFLRALYCVDASYRPLTGAAATALSCPAEGGFVAANPGLFKATGFAHHPYSFFLAPATAMADPNFVPLSDLGRLEGGLDAIFKAYGIDRKLPLYLTEYGYATDPPNPYSGVSLSLQAEYLNQGEYLAFRDPRVRALSQFLLYDSPPNTQYPRGSVRYWSTFQTGLLFADGSAKPSLDAYRLPLFLPRPRLRDGRALIWAQLRPARAGEDETADVQWRGAAGAFRTVGQIKASGTDQIAQTESALPGPGQVRLRWVSPQGQAFFSRSVAVASG